MRNMRGFRLPRLHRSDGFDVCGGGQVDVVFIKGYQSRGGWWTPWLHRMKAGLLRPMHWCVLGRFYVSFLLLTQRHQR
jgi:hypothetical protein